MASTTCLSCNGLKHDDGAKSHRSTSVLLLQKSKNKGCRSCQMILDGLHSLLELQNDYEVEINSDEAQKALKVLVWTGPRMTRNPRKSKIENSVAPLRFEFFTRPGEQCQWTAIGARSEISKESASESCCKRIRSWIKNCTEIHIDCRQSTPTPLPSRVLDVGPPDFPSVKLIETRGRAGQYLALSHCWGGHQPLRTTTATLSERLAGIEWAHLPKTFQDAVIITRRLGVQYIWIDSLCIIQDDGADWEVEAASMGTIYEGSLLTISASTASNPDHGIFSPRAQANKINLTNEDGTTSAVYVRKMLDHSILSTDASKASSSTIPLLTRAWAYQERLLATRVLHYLPDELFWECHSAIRCECGIQVPEAKLRLQSKRGFSKIIQRNQSDVSKQAVEPWRWTVIEVKMWPQIVAEYSARDLTFRKDRLPALSGVAKRLYASKPSMRYLAGIWMENLPEALLWRVLKKRPKENQTSRAVNGPLGIRASRLELEPRPPSWAWTSVEGGNMSISYPEQKLIQERVEIISAETSPSGIDPFSLVEGGKIKLRGPVIATIMTYSTDEKDGVPILRYNITCEDITTIFIPDTPISNKDDFGAVESGATVYCLWVGSFKPQDIQVLVLRRSSLEIGMYERLGLLVFVDRVNTETRASVWFGKAELTEVILV